MHDHFAEAIKGPAVIALSPRTVCLRFETMKLYSALGAVRHLLESGTVQPGDTLIDSSSGIYAHALALACHRYGLGCYIVGSMTIDTTLRVQLEILGATLEQVRPSNSLRLDQNLRVQRINELLADNPRFHWMRQYHDEIHYLGYREVARIVDHELPDVPLGIVGGVGTGASTGALGTYLAEAGRDTTLVGVQPFGSVTFGADHIDDPDMIIAGIGSCIDFKNVRHDLYDRIHWVSFDYASSAAIALLRDSGIFAGLSAGAAYLATRWEWLRDPSRTFVFLAADTGHRYVDSAFTKHREARQIESLKPREITELNQLEYPWSTMLWNRSGIQRERGETVGVSGHTHDL